MGGWTVALTPAPPFLAVEPCISCPTSQIHSFSGYEMSALSVFFFKTQHPEQCLAPSRSSINFLVDGGGNP